MRRPFQAIVVSLAIACSAYAGQAADPPELQRYVEEARAWGMGESALLTLRTVASITTGGSTISFVKEPSSARYYPAYQSTSCPPRNADSLALREYREAVSAKLDPEVHALRALADTDSSGFVSNLEARDLRQLVEFGYLVAFLEGLGLRSAAGLAEATQVDQARLAGHIQSYNNVAATLNARRQTPLDVRLPVLKGDL